jgi:hypothetical protein
MINRDLIVHRRDNKAICFAQCDIRIHDEETITGWQLD